MGSIGAEVLSAGDVDGRNLGLPRVGRLARASVLVVRSGSWPPECPPARLRRGAGVCGAERGQVGR
jgi:hypothetical protein